MISEKAEKLLTELKDIVRSRCVFSDEYASIEFQIRVFYLENLIDGLEFRERYLKDKVSNTQKLLEISDKQGIRLLIENCEYKDALRTAGEYIDQLIEVGSDAMDWCDIDGFVQNWESLVKDWKERDE